jgi:hypothetical protein
LTVVGIAYLDPDVSAINVDVSFRKSVAIREKKLGGGDLISDGHLEFGLPETGSRILAGSGRDIRQDLD